MARKKVKKEDISEFEKIIEYIDENSKPVAKNLLDRLKFMNGTLMQLEEQIKSEGAVIKGLNGNGFETVTEHPAQKSYNTMIGRYNALIKTFMELIPKAEQHDDFIDFISGGG